MAKVKSYYSNKILQMQNEFSEKEQKVLEVYIKF